MNPAELTGAVVRSFREPTTGAAPAAAGPHRWPDLADTLRARVARRGFAPEPVDPTALLASVRAGLDLDRRAWPGEADCCPLEPVLVVLRATGDLAPALYRYRDGGPDRVGDLPEHADLVLQREFATAGVLVSLLSDVDGAVARHGGHGYRTLMTRAGAAGYAIWLRAIGHGLVGTVFAGFLPAAVRRPLRLDGATRHQVFAVALGCPPAATTADGADGTRSGSATAR